MLDRSPHRAGRRDIAEHVQRAQVLRELGADDGDWTHITEARLYHYISAFGGSDRKLFLPSLQKGTKSVVFMLPAIRCGRSEKNVMTELTPSSVSMLVALSKRIPFEVCTKRKSACGRDRACHEQANAPPHWH